MATTPEGRVKAKIKKALKPYIDGGYMWAHWPVPYGYGKREIDCLGCHHGEFFGIEAKAPGKHPTKLQEDTIAEMRRAGAKVFVIDGDEGIDELMQWLYRERRIML